jgi:hypothetical protein
MVSGLLAFYFRPKNIDIAHFHKNPMGRCTGLEICPFINSFIVSTLAKSIDSLIFD